MPVIIRELHIRTTIVDMQENANEKQKEEKGKHTGSEELVALCVEQVMLILKDKEER